MKSVFILVSAGVLTLSCVPLAQAYNDGDLSNLNYQFGLFSSGYFTGVNANGLDLSFADLSNRRWATGTGVPTFIGTNLTGTNLSGDLTYFGGVNKPVNFTNSACRDKPF
jgi:uncharacterized protein YjbI with pentapeptide repeats